MPKISACSAPSNAWACRLSQHMETKRIAVIDRNDFRQWLIKHHDKETRVAVVLHKKHTGKSAPTHRELIEEAICFGWIDTTIKRIDDDKFLRNFSRRSKNSKWSDNTLGYAKQLAKQGKMTAVGLDFYRQGLKRPTHDHGMPKNPTVPLELKQALARNKNAKEVFDTFPPSKKKMLYRWILGAKLVATRQKRTETILEAIRIGKKDIIG